jgi:hypothetical protein
VFIVFYSSCFFTETSFLVHYPRADLKSVGDEVCSDAFPIKEVDDIVYEIDSKMVTIKQGVDVDIGANASAEEAEESLEDGAETVNDVAYTFRLQATSFDKKSYMTYIKSYMKKVKAHLETAQPDRVTAFEKGATTVVKKVLANFKDYEFYIGESMDPDGMVLLLNYRDDGITPYFTVFKDGLKIEKL